MPLLAQHHGPDQTSFLAIFKREVQTRRVGIRHRTRGWGGEGQAVSGLPMLQKGLKLPRVGPPEANQPGKDAQCLGT